MNADLTNSRENKLRRVLTEVDSGIDDEVKFLQDLIRIPTENPPGRYDQAAAFIDSFARRNGLQSQILETPEEICRKAGVNGPPRLSIKTTLGEPGRKPAVLLLAHLDTVPIGDEAAWQHGPFSGDLVEGRIYGRGACDCKGRIAGYLFAQLALKRAACEIPGELTMACTADEEIGGHTGAEYLLESGKLDCDFCIGEGYTWEIFNGFKGLLWAKVSIRGRSAHGSTPQLGVSVIPPLQTFLERLEEYRNTLRSDTTLNVGVVKAGSKINMVPDLATVEIDMRLANQEEVVKALDDLNNSVEKIKTHHKDVAIEIEFMNRVDPITINRHHPLVETLYACAQEVSPSPIPVKLWFAHSDTVHFLKKGIPSVNYGVGRAGVAHTTDEHVYVEDLKLATKIIALTAAKLLGVGNVS